MQQVLGSRAGWLGWPDKIKFIQALAFGGHNYESGFDGNSLREVVGSAVWQLDCYLGFEETNVLPHEHHLRRSGHRRRQPHHQTFSLS